MYIICIPQLSVLCIFCIRVSTVSLDNDIQTTSSSTLIAGGKIYSSYVRAYIVLQLHSVTEGIRPNMPTITSSPKPEVLAMHCHEC